VEIGRGYGGHALWHTIRVNSPPLNKLVIGGSAAATSGNGVGYSVGPRREAVSFCARRHTYQCVASPHLRP
jgi:hypothetical protein